MLPSGSLDPVPLNWMTCPTVPEYGPPGFAVGSWPPAETLAVVVALLVAPALSVTVKVMVKRPPPV